MISFVVCRDKDGSLRGFRSSGHAGMAESGKDIICAGVSALVINCINSIESFCPDDMKSASVLVEEESGTIQLMLSDRPSESCELLLRSLILGITNVQQQYGKRYIEVKDRR